VNRPRFIQIRSQLRVFGLCQTNPLQGRDALAASALRGNESDTASLRIGPIDVDFEGHGASFVLAVIYRRSETRVMPRHPRPPRHLGALPPRYSFVLNPYVRERFTKCPTCKAPTRIRKIPLVVHVGNRDTPRLAFLNKTCRLCLLCETLIVDRAELERVIVGAGFGDAVLAEDYVVLGTVDRRTGRRGLAGTAEVLNIRGHMADFKKYLKVDVVPAHWERSTETAG
jgi:hypothetical protein